MQAFDLIIFGGTGDLAMHKLLPALFQRFRDTGFEAGSRVIAVAREALDDVHYREQVHAALAPIAAGHEAELARFLEGIGYQAVDVRAQTGWEQLAARIRAAASPVRVFYLALHPDLFTPVCDHLRALDLHEGEARVVLEKPIGSSLASASAIADAVARTFSERQTFRIDHYLGKETVQNLLALRFANALFEPLWNAEHIDHVQITVAETVGVGDRAAYYDRAGALRDMVQNHLLQLLCLVAMEPPVSLTADAMRDEKLKVLHALKPIDARNAGATDRARPVPRRGDRRARRCRAISRSWAALIRAPRPSSRSRPRSTTGAGPACRSTCAPASACGERVSEIVISFRSVPHSIFGREAGELAPNKLVLRLQPDEGVKLWLMNKVPGPGGIRLRHVPLDMSFAAAFGGHQADAYERLLMDVVRGNATLVHAPRRGRGGVALDRSDHRRLGRRTTRRSTLHRRQLGAERRGCPDRT